MPVLDVDSADIFVASAITGFERPSPPRSQRGLMTYEVSSREFNKHVFSHWMPPQIPSTCMSAHNRHCPSNAPGFCVFHFPLFLSVFAVYGSSMLACFASPSTAFSSFAPRNTLVMFSCCWEKIAWFRPCTLYACLIMSFKWDRYALVSLVGDDWKGDEENRAEDDRMTTLSEILEPLVTFFCCRVAADTFECTGCSRLLVMRNFDSGATMVYPCG